LRRIVLDTETTGLEPEEGHRIIELACLELSGRRPTGRHFHRYVNPERSIDRAASEVHGLTAEDLQDKPRFGDIADEFLDFVAGAELLIHNAPFDVAFLNAELERTGRPRLESVCSVADTLEMAREMHPGKKNSLDALCERYAVDHSKRTLHGALLDAQLLADVWIAMTRGQETLGLGLTSTSWGPLSPGAAQDGVDLGIAEPFPRSARIVIRASDEELIEHAAMCERIQRESRGRCLWMQATAAAS
jgi:DNA polymerase-3 subunit epsilon